LLLKSALKNKIVIILRIMAYKKIYKYSRDTLYGFTADNLFTAYFHTPFMGNIPVVSNLIGSADHYELTRL